MPEAQPMNPSQPTGPGDEHQRVIAEAAERARKLRGAVKMAAFNGWSMAVFAALCLPFALFDTTSLVMGVALGVLAWNELEGKAGLIRFDPKSPRRLGWNQIALLHVILVYCGWSAYLIKNDPNSSAQQILNDPMLRQQFSGLADSLVTLSMGMYAIVFLVSLLVQGYCARYYFARQRVMRELVESTPPWALEMLRAARAD